MARKKIVETEEKQETKIYPLIGHSKHIGFLRQGIENKKSAHAYLITGPEHVGKERMALEFIGLILKKQAKNLRSGIDFTVIERGFDEKKKRHGFAISVDQIKALRSQLTRQSLVADYTIVLIREAETMNRSAANALLKTLEEPIPNTCIILLANHEEQMLGTIRSRCQIIRLATVLKEEIESALVAAGVEKDIACSSAELCRGLPGVAINCAHEKNIQDWHKQEAERFFKIFGATLHDKFQLVAPFVGSNRNSDHVSARETVKELLTMWEILLRDMVFARYNLKQHIVYKSFESEFQTVANNISAPRLGALIEEIENAQELLGQNVNGRILLEHLLLKINTYETTA